MCGRAACGVRASCAGELFGRAAGEREIMDVRGAQVMFRRILADIQGAACGQDWCSYWSYVALPFF